ncbi:unnamed protein product [Peronospora destructor]|uniref:Kinesin motor domain-containing protein n=1 Tax=Peronospora destructor TaxID=86335 RepID=A0AAV0UYZ0_9STRA|nr:unnamed protein product [Peronospora destructor]
MERVHVFVRLQDKASLSSTVGVSRTSTTTVRVEHGEMSPGVANLTFEQVFDVDDSNFHVFQTSLTDPVDSILDGKAVTLIATGTTRSDTSFACHGDQEKSMNKKREPDLITLAIRRIFSNLEVTVTKKTVQRSKTCVITNIGKNIEEIHVEHGVMVSTSTEAEHLYSRALERMKDAENQDFLFVLHVETLLPSGEARRGRLLAVNINEGFINEPRGEELTYQNENGQQNILKTQLLKNEVLSAGFGSFIGQQSLTYLLVTIPTLAQFQQQAVQLLLYASKAQEIKRLSSRNSSSAFGERSHPNQFLETKTRSLQKTGNQTADFCREDSVATGAPSYQAFPADGSTAPIFVMPSPPTSPPLSTTSSDSMHEVSFFTYSSQQEKSQTVSPHCSPSTSCGSEDFEKESVVSMRLRRAYELAKAATSSPRKSAASDSISSDEVVSDALADELLKHIPRDARHRLTLQANFSRIGAAQVDPECSLVHVIVTKDECVDRIIENANKLKNNKHASRLSHNMTCRVAEYEQQLHEALTAQHAARPQLRNSHIKFDDVGREVARLQEEVRALQARQQILTDNGDAQSSEIDQAMLRTLSVRLDETMMQAKDVIKFKDGVIHSLEERLQLASKRGADAVTMLQKEKDQFEREKAQLVVQLQQSNEKSKNDKGNTEEVSRLQAENVAIQQQKADLTRRVVQLTVELETALLQWTQEARDREERAEQRCAEQVFQAEQQLRQATAAMQHQMAQFRDELDARMTKQRVATQVACTAGELKKDQLERELQRMKLTLAKQKVKMEKKSRALVATACKQYEQPMARLKRKLDYQSARIDTILEREQVTLRRARKSEKAVEGWQTETQQLQASVTELVRERNALKDLCKELKQDNEVLKGELERQLLEMEQSVAQQVIAAETRMHEERDVQVENIVKQHIHEISRLRAATREQQEALKFKVVQLVQQQSSSTVSSQVSSAEDDLLFSDSCEQRSIDALDAEIGGSKERLHKRVGQRRKAGNSSRSPSFLPPAKNAASLNRALAHKEEEIKELSVRQKQLLTALATANEQETLAKKQIHETEAERQRELARYEELLQQLNCVKQENWNINLALHVTEAATCSSQNSS